jgi:ribosomal protein S18 acetylase RimI-like enzyme
LRREPQAETDVSDARIDPKGVPMILVRDAGAGDGNEVVELIREFAAEYNQTSPITPAVVERYLATPHHHALLAEWDGRAAGLLSYVLRFDLWHAADCCFVEDFVVKKPFRGRGIGSALLKFLLSRAEREGCAEVSLTVDPSNTRAQELYKRLGIDEEKICLEKHVR